MKNNKLMQSILAIIAIAALFAATTSTAHAQDTVENYLREYPNQQQVKMMETWLKKNEKGTFWFTGLVDHTDTTVVTAQATVDLSSIIRQDSERTADSRKTRKSLQSLVTPWAPYGIMIRDFK